MNNKPKLLLILAMSLPLLILLSMSFLPLTTYFFGKEILLEIKPIDSKDLLQGDYVSINYKINDVPKALFPEQLKHRTKFNDPINMYAILRKEGSYYVVDQMSYKKPNHPYYLPVKVNLSAPIDKIYSNMVNVEYPMDEYFALKRTDNDTKKSALMGHLVAKIKVWNSYPLLIDVFPKE